MSVSGGYGADERHEQVVRENDALILDRLLGMLHELPRREREAVLAGCAFKERLRDTEATAERQYEELLWISEYPNRTIPGEPDAVELAEAARAALSAGEEQACPRCGRPTTEVALHEDGKGCTRCFGPLDPPDCGGIG